jgi:Cof subfamily protein (haloacid dehalogenase superfamily)
MRPFDLVILDLDGTILDPYKRAAISPGVQAAIAAVQAAGVPLTIGTGRTLDYLRHQFPGDLQLAYPAVTTQGAVIGDPRTGRVLVEQDLPLAAARALAAWVDNESFMTAFYFLDQDGAAHAYRNRIGATPEEEELLHHLLGYPFSYCEKFAPLLAAPAAHPPIKVITYDDPAKSGRDLLIEMGERFSLALSIIRTHIWLVEATAPGVDKGSALRKLCELLQIDPQRVLAIGDSENDIPMMQTAGFAIAMGNATDHVKAVADWIAPTIDEDGAAVALRRWVLGEAAVA